MEQFEYELTPTDIEILVEECNNEISQCNRELGMLMVKQKILRKKIEEWKGEKQWLELIRDTSTKNAQNYFDSLTKTKARTIRTRYNELMEKFKNMNITPDTNNVETDNNSETKKIKQTPKKSKKLK